MLINTGNISRKVLSKVLRSFDKNFERLQKGGLVCYHGHGIVINAEKIGKNLSIWQGVTIGKNINSEQLPIIGDNVKIGAGAVVMKDVPSDSVVIGNPCVIKKR